MNNCTLDSKLYSEIKSALKQNVDSAYTKYVDDYFSSFDKALNASDFIKEKVDVQTAISAKTVSNAGTAVVLQLLDIGGQALQKAIFARALIQLRTDLNQRILVLNEINIHLNVIKTCLNLIINNIDFLDKKTDFFNRLTQAANNIKLAYTRLLQLESIYTNTSIFNDAVYRQAQQHLKIAQDFLIAPEIQQYQQDFKEYVNTLVDRPNDGIGSYFVFDIDILLDAVAASTLGGNSTLGKAAIALNPLYNFITGNLDSRISRIMIAIQLAFDSLKELIRLLPASFNIITNSLQASANLVVSLISSNDANAGGFFGQIPERDVTLLELNGKILNKLAILKQLDSKLYDFNNIVNPLVSSISSVTNDLITLHAEIKEELITAQTNDELVTKASGWSNRVAKAQIQLGLVTPKAAETISDITVWLKTWSILTEYIDNYNIDDDKGTYVFVTLISNLASIAMGITSKSAAMRSRSKIIEIQYNIDLCIKRDREFVRLIDELKLEQYTPEIKIVDDIIKFCDEVFPILGEIIRTGDINVITKAVKDTILDSAPTIIQTVAAVGSAIKQGFVASKAQRFADNSKECADNLANLFSTGDDEDYQRENIEEYYIREKEKLG